MFGKRIACIVAILLGFALLSYPKLNAVNDAKQKDPIKPAMNGYCWSSKEEIDRSIEDLLPLFNRITTNDYFRYFKVNTEKPCPFWVVNLLCTSEDDACKVCKCDEDNIPKELREQVDMSDYTVPDSHILQVKPHPLNVDKWGSWKTNGEGSEYVDLLQNPEANTGFTGPMSMKVWQAIYKENCFPLTKKTCIESSVLQTLLSGLHTSIGIHVCVNFYKDKQFKSPLHKIGIHNNPNISFYPNCEMFREKIQPNEEFILNLYTLFQFTLRALTRAKHSFINDAKGFNFGDGTPLNSEHEGLYSNLLQLFDSNLLCTKTFDEVLFLESPKVRELIPQMKSILANVSHIMDCVPCEKCRVWGKLSIKGLATAMEINMSPETNYSKLDRAGKFTLMNLARQLSFSVRGVSLLNKLCSV